jgi:hypothetical protein
MDDLRVKVRETLLKKMGVRKLDNPRARNFRSDSDIDHAVDALCRRIEYYEKMSKRVGSMQAALDLPTTSVIDLAFPQNDVPLNRLVPISTRSGLCPLPGRVDCLSGMSLTYPDDKPETDLSMKQVLSEPAQVALPPNSLGADDVNVKRMRIKKV